MKTRRKLSTKTKVSKKTEKSQKTETDDSFEANTLTNESEIELIGYQKESKYLTKLVNNTIETGESNSVLICGDPGSGKTALVENCLNKIKSNPNVSIIKLNGLVNSNDLNTIKIIGRHLGITGITVNEIMNGLKKICEEKPELRVIIILDRFDIFCRKNQTLLYNLLDVLQNSNSICLIGMTSRLDSIDLLEKRVKSRLNQRVIQLITPFDNFDDYLKYGLKLLNRTEISDSLRESLRTEFSLNYSIKELKRFLFEYKVCEKTGLELSVVDIKQLSLSQLSKYEISVLLIANRFIKNQNKSEFHCFAIMDALRHLPQIKISQNMLFKIIYKLLETDLISRVSSVKNNDLLLTEWTQFRLNIDDSHLNHILSSNSFPSYMKQI